MFSRYRGVLYQGAAAGLFLAALAVVRANVECGMNDDWSFIRTARDTAATGRLIYNGWSAPLIGFQAYWGALFVKAFGFSFFTVRASSWALTVLSIPVLWGLLRRLELTEQQAFFGVTAFLLSPLTLPNLATFMTDMPAFFLFAAAVLCGLKAWDEADDGRALWWVGAAALLGILSGSVRQIYWLGGICILAVLGVKRLRGRGRVFAAVCGVATVVVGAAATVWLNWQPYVPVDVTLRALRETPGRVLLHYCVGQIVRDLLSLAVVSIPFTLPLAYLQARRMRWRVHVAAVPLAFLFVWRMANPLPWVGNTLSEYGVVNSSMLSVGDKPLVLSQPVVLLVGTVGAVCALYALALFARGELGFALESGAGRFAALTVPFLVLYVGVLIIRAPASGVFDRYLIPHLFVSIALAVYAYNKLRGKLSGGSVAMAAVFAGYALATTHDYFAEARAKLEATNEVLRAGQSRDSILSGFEFDSWTQTEVERSENNSLVKRPPGVYREAEECDGPDGTLTWWRPLTPVVKVRWVIALEPVDGLERAGFAPVRYWRWLPLKHDSVYVEKVPKEEAPLTCGAS